MRKLIFPDIPIITILVPILKNTFHKMSNVSNKAMYHADNHNKQFTELHVQVVLLLSLNSQYVMQHVKRKDFVAGFFSTNRQQEIKKIRISRNVSISF